MISIVINKSYSCFSLSEKAEQWLKDRGLEFKYYFDIPRHHPLLIQCIKELGIEAEGKFAKLEIVNINSDRYIIKEYDGYEKVITPEDIKWINVFNLVVPKE